MSKDLPSQAKYWGVQEHELHILRLIGSWINGRPLTVRGEERQIGTHHDLPLEDMFRHSKWNYEVHAHAHQKLLKNGHLKKTYICRRKIDWAPTETGRQAMRDVLKPWSEELRPDWADKRESRGRERPDKYRSGPLYGDPNAGVLHRKGVETAGALLPHMAWAYDITRPGQPAYGVEWYPTYKRGEACHDLHIDTQEHMSNVGVEVVTDNNDTSRIVNKWKRFQTEDRLTLWLFEGREHACRFYNQLDKRGEFYLDGQFQTPQNWSSKAINRKVWRSSKKYRDRPAGDLVQSVTGLLEGGEDTVQDLFNDYHSRT